MLCGLMGDPNVYCDYWDFKLYKAVLQPLNTVSCILVAVRYVLLKLHAPTYNTLTLMSFDKSIITLTAMSFSIFCSSYFP